MIEVAITVREYARRFGHKNVANIYAAISRDEIPAFIPAGFKTLHIPAWFVEQQSLCDGALPSKSADSYTSPGSGNGDAARSGGRRAAGGEK